MSMQTALSKAHGLGASGEGPRHWWMQRVTSIALIPLSLWFGFSLVMLPNLSHSTVFIWIGEPLTTVSLLTFIIAGCYHMALGLRVVIEDYVHWAALKISMIILVELGSFFLALTGIVATMRIFL